MRIRPCTIDDAQVIHEELGCNPAMLKYTGWNPYSTLESTIGFLEHALAAEGEYSWVIEDGDVPVGTIGAYDFDAEAKTIEIGCSIFEKYWGKGYASEAICLACECLTGQAGIKTVKAWSHPENAASIKAMEKNGFAQVGAEGDQIFFERPRTVSVETMRKSDAYTIANFVPSKELMRRAGQAIFDSADWKAPVAVVCGKGNNAGDGYVVAALMKDAGIDCTIFLIDKEAFSEDGRYYYDICIEKGVPVQVFDVQTDLSGYGSVLDAMLGTGFAGDVRGITADAINAINASGAYVVSADINSGLNGDTGEGTTFVKSDLTVSIGDFKHGHFKGQCDVAMKDKVNCDIGIVII